MTFYVRTASPRDLEAVQRLLAETWHATYDDIYGVERVREITAEWHSMPALQAQLTLPESEFLIADDGKEIAAMAFAVSADEGRTVMLRQLYVLPARQGVGIGGMLLDEIEGCFPGAERIRLEVEAGNAKAVAFYMAMGFAQVGSTDDCGAPGSGIAALVYERPITSA